MYTIPKVISNFHNDGNFVFSNFYEHPVAFEGDYYKSSEAAFQAAKTLDKSLRRPIMLMSAAESKKAGRKLDLRPDWEQVKDGIMEEILRDKFKTGFLRDCLLKTKGIYLIEGNMWHDNYWGYCYCNKCKDVLHRNQLGVTLMEVRDSLL